MHFFYKGTGLDGNDQVRILTQNTVPRWGFTLLNKITNTRNGVEKSSESYSFLLNYLAIKNINLNIGPNLLYAQ